MREPPISANLADRNGRRFHLLGKLTRPRMRRWYSIFLASALTAMTTHAGAADDAGQKGPLKVLYVGNTNTERGRSYARFLGEKFTLAGAADRKTFNPGSLPEVDVVVLDWSQSDIDRGVYSARKPSGWESDLKSPLGERSRWSKPTVLLGSAGHLLAAPWQVIGGAG
jgi:hypothetical protein